MDQVSSKEEWPDMPTVHDDKSEEEIVKHIPVVTHALITQVQQQDSQDTRDT